MKRLLSVVFLYALYVTSANAQVSSFFARHIRTGAALPGACSPVTGDVFFRTGATNPGLYDCPTVNTWRFIASATSSIAVQANTVSQGNAATLNFGAGIQTSCAAGTCTETVDTATIDTRVNNTNGSDKTISVVTGTGSAYIGCPTGNSPAGNAITALVDGTILAFKPNVNGVAGAITLAICGGAGGPTVAIKKSDGTNAGSTDIVASTWYHLTYDATSTSLRLPATVTGGGTRYIQIPVTGFVSPTAGNILLNNYTGTGVAVYGTLWTGAISALVFANTGTPQASGQFILPPDMDLTQAIKVDFLMGTDNGTNGNGQFDLGFDCVALNTQLTTTAHTFTNTASTGSVVLAWLQQKSVKVSFASLTGCAVDQMGVVNVARNNSVSGNAAGGVEIWSLIIEYKSKY